MKSAAAFVTDPLLFLIYRNRPFDGWPILFSGCEICEVQAAGPFYECQICKPQPPTAGPFYECSICRIWQAKSPFLLVSDLSNFASSIFVTNPNTNAPEAATAEAYFLTADRYVLQVKRSAQVDFLCTKIVQMGILRPTPKTICRAQ
jgi:hypothetical protein